MQVEKSSPEDHANESPFSNSGLFPTKNVKKSKRVLQKEGEIDFNSILKSLDADGNKHNSSHTHTMKLKIGTKVTAKVYQIRARGLVLDLGGGLRGMYRFETDGKDFEVGDELRVECSSFSSKGIPVVSLVDDQ